MNRRGPLAAVLSSVLFAGTALAQQQPPPVDENAPIRGRIHLELDRSVWVESFVVDPKGPGLERLSSRSALAEFLSSLNVKRLWRSFGQVEEPIGRDRILVVSYETWEKKWDAKRPRRPNERPYAPLSLPSAPSIFELQLGDEVTPDVLEKLRRIEGVISADQVTRPALNFTPNDPGWVVPSDPSYNTELAAGRWGFHNTGAALGPEYLDDFDIDAPEAWDIQRGDPALVVAVLDSTIDVGHGDLYLNIFLNNVEVPAAVVTAFRAASTDDGLPGELTFYDLNVPSVVTDLAAMGFRDTNANGRIEAVDAVAWWTDGVDDDGNGYADDLAGWNFIDGTNRPFGTADPCLDCDHGTKSSGLIGAVANNGRDIAGVAHRVRVLPVPRPREFFAALPYAVSFSQVRVINSSTSDQLLMPSQSEINRFFRSLNPRGVTYVASLGNTDGLYYGLDPAQREEVIVVTNFDSTGRRAAPFGSGAGPKTDVAAPAQGVYSTSIRSGGSLESGWFGGTSGASPMTAGVAALLMSQWPTLSPEQVRQVLRMTAVDPVAVSGDRAENTPGWDLYSGWGLVNARNALDAAVSRTEYAEANITSRFRNFTDYGLFDMSIGIGRVEIRAAIGLPRSPSTDVSWTLRRSANWAMSGAVDVASGSSVYSDDALLATIDTDPLDGRQVVELEVRTPSGAVSRDRAVIDLPRAYIARSLDARHVMGPMQIVGYAYGPGFSRYHIQVAPGWSPSDEEFRDVASSSVDAAPSLPLEPGEFPGMFVLGTVDVDSLPIAVPSSNQVTVRVLTEGIRTWHHDIRITALTTHPPLRAGFPPDRLGSTIGGSPTAVDLDGDGQKEIILTGGDLVVKRSNGRDFPGFPVSIPGSEYVSHAAAVGDIDGDGSPEIVLRTTEGRSIEWIRIVRTDGSFVTDGWPARIDKSLETVFIENENPPVLADLDGDGRLDILVSIDRSTSAPSPLVRAYRHNGGVIANFPTEANFEHIGPVAVGDLDADGRPEIVAAVGSDRTPTRTPLLFVWRADGALAWTSELNVFANRFAGRPELIDIDGDGRLEIVVGEDFSSVKILDADGNTLASTPVEQNHRLAVGQLRPNDMPADTSVIFATRVFRDELRAYRTIVHLRESSMLAARPGWATGVDVGVVGSPRAQPIVADLRGDAQMEIAVVNFSDPFLVAGDISMILANADGTLVRDTEWPIRLPPGGISATPLVSDIDGDGRLNLVVLSMDGGIYAFDLGPSHTGAIAWGEYGHDPRRSSNYHGDLRILEPSTVYAVPVGPFDDPSLQSRLLVRAQFSRGTPVSGDTDPANWNVKIGDVIAPVRSVTRVMGVHFLEIEPVAQPAPGPRTLRVEFNDGGIRTWDAYANAVTYDRRRQVALLFDTSGSMERRPDGSRTADPAERKISLARQAALPFLVLLNDFAALRAEFGIAAFPAPSRSSTCEAEVMSPTQIVNDANIAVAIGTTVPALTPAGITPLIAGVETARTMLSPGTQSVIVLLSDGYHNCPSEASVGDPEVTALIDRLQGQGTRVFSVGFGSPADIDHPLLEALATNTTPPGFSGSQFYDVTAPGFDPATWDPATALQATYKSVLIDALGLDGVVDPLDTIGGGRRKTFEVNINEHDRIVSFYLSWKTLQINRLQMTIRSSDGETVPAFGEGIRLHQGSTYTILTVGPEFLTRRGKVGRRAWSFEVSSPAVDPKESEQFQYSVIVDSALQMRAGFDRLSSRTGDPILLKVELRERGQLLKSAKAEVILSAPSSLKSTNIPLFDDATHGDVVANDGIYSTIYKETSASGTYAFRFHAEGKTSAGNSFTRERVAQRLIRIKAPSDNPP